MTETQENPLVATSEAPSGVLTNTGDSAKPEADRLNAQTAGSGLFNDAASTLTDVRNGDWGNAAFDVGTDALDLLGAAMDPLGTLASAGVGWLIEHISFLKQGLDELAGNPEAVTAKAVTWSNVSKQLTTSADEYEKSAATLGQSFTDGNAAAAYQATAKSYAATLRGAAGHAQGASTAMNIGAALAGTERGLIRDMISSFVGELIIKGIAALAASWCSFGGTVAAFIADTVIEGSILAEKISTKIAKVVEKLETLAKSAGKSKAAIESAANALKKVGKGLDKAVGKGVDVAAKLDGKAADLKQAAKDAKEVKAATRAENWTTSAKNAVPGREHVEGAGDAISEDGRSFLSQKEWRNGGGSVPKPNIADGVGVATEGRRQENEQIDRYAEGQEKYKQEHEKEVPKGEPAASAPAE
jgi:hypothetical protein